MTFVRRLFSIPVIGLWLALTMSPLASAETMDFKLNGTDEVRGTGRSEKGASLPFKWNADLKLGLLGGEPVVSLRFRFDASGGTVTLPVLEAGIRDEKYQTMSFAVLPQGLRDKVRLTEVKLRISFFSEVGIVDLVADVGATGAPGQWSFNVPGSPDWDHLFLKEGSRSMWLSAGVAKAAWAKGLTVSSVRVEAADLNLYLLHSAYMKDYGRERYRAMGPAYSRLREAIERSYDIEVGNVSGAWSGAYLSKTDLGSAANWSRRNGELDALLKKLSSLPDGFRDGSNHGPYQQAVKEVAILQKSLDAAVASFKAEGRNPNSFEKGREPKFDRERPALSKNAMYVQCFRICEGDGLIFAVTENGLNKEPVLRLKGDEKLRHKSVIVDSRDFPCSTIVSGGAVDGLTMARHVSGTPIDFSMIECKKGYRLRLLPENPQFFRYKPKYNKFDTRVTSHFRHEGYGKFENYARSGGYYTVLLLNEAGHSIAELLFHEGFRFKKKKD